MECHSVPNAECRSLDYILLNVTQVGYWTALVFKREWETCDGEHDLAIIVGLLIKQRNVFPKVYKNNFPNL